MRTKLSALRSLLARLVAALDHQVQRVGQAGAWPAAYPTILGVALAAAVLEFFPKAGVRVHPRWGAVVLVAVGVLVLHLVLLAVAFVRKRMLGAFDWIAASRALWGHTAFVAALPLVLQLRSPLEKSRPFLVLAYAAVIGLLCGYSAYHWRLPKRLAPWWERQRQRRWTALVSLALLLGLWGAYSWKLSDLSITDHLAFNTGRIDLGWYMNIVRRSSIGDFLGCTLCSSGTHINAHFDPILVLISPIYLLYPETETLLVLQSVWLGSGVIPLYLLARHHSLQRGSTLGICLCYCLYPALHGINLFDFHSLALLVPVVVWLWLCFEKLWVKRFFAVLALLLLVREDAALLSICLGTAFLISGKPRALLLGGSTILLATCYFLAVKGLVMPNADLLNKAPGKVGYSHYYQELVPKGKETTAGVVSALVSDPARVLGLALQEEKVVYLGHLGVPLLFTPVLARWGKIALGYGLAFGLLATREFVHTVHFHYSANIVPVAFVLAVAGVAVAANLGSGRFDVSRLQRALVMAMVVCTTVCSIKFGGIFPNASFKGGFEALERKPTKSHIARDRWLKDLCQRLPEDATITASSPLIPHLGRCRTVINFMRHRQAEYVVWVEAAFKKNDGKWTKRVKADLEKGTLVKIDEGYGMVLLQRKAKPAP